jgi:hypothetical protein
MQLDAQDSNLHSDEAAVKHLDWAEVTPGVINCR